MTEELEIQSTEGAESGEVSAEAVEKLAKQLQSGGAQDTKREQKVHKMNTDTAHVMVKMLKSPGKGTLAKLMAKAIHEGNPPTLVLGISSLACSEINLDMPRVDMLIFQKNTWPSEHREHLEDWEKIVVASLEHCVEDFRKAVKQNSGILPNLSSLIEYVLKKTCNITSIKGQSMVDGLVAIVSK